MPRAPLYQPNQVAPVQVTGERLRAANNNGGAWGGVAQGLAGAGNAVGQYADAQDKINAQNDDTQTRAVTADLTPQYSQIIAKYQTLKAGAAREGQAQVTQELNALREAGMAKAINGRQRRLLTERLSGLHSSALAQIGEHAVKEQQVERAGVLTSQRDAFVEAGQISDDPTFQANSLASALSVERQRMIEVDGIDPESSPEAFRLGELAVSTKFHAGMVDKMFADADPDIDMIMAYRAAHLDEMSGELATSILGRVQKPFQERMGRADAELVLEGITGADEPRASAPVAGGNNLDDITAHAESGGREYRADGSRITSPVGARGLMQVMPGTARDPGFGIRPSDGSPAEDARVGREYRKKMEDRYGGDLAKMWGAYNWGPGNVDSAIKRYGDNWLAHAPEETQNYVARNITAVGGDTGARYGNAPREWDRAAIEKRLNDIAARQGWSPERMQRAREEVDRHISRDEGLLNDQRQAADEQAANVVATKGDGFTSTNMIPRNVWNTLTPVQRRQYEDIAENNRAPKAVAANGETAVALSVMRIQDPDKFAQFNLAKARAYLTPAEFEQFAKDQATIQKGGGAVAADVRPKIDATIGRMKSWGGVDLGDNPVEALRVRRYMETQADELRSKGKEPAQADFDRWFGEATQGVKVQNYVLGVPTSTEQRRSSAYLSPNYRAVIKREFRQQYGRDPSEAEVQHWFDRLSEGAPAK